MQEAERTVRLRSTGRYNWRVEGMHAVDIHGWVRITTVIADLVEAVREPPHIAVSVACLRGVVWNVIG